MGRDAAPERQPDHSIISGSPLGEGTGFLDATWSATGRRPPGSDAGGAPPIVVGVDVGGSGARAALIRGDGCIVGDIVSTEWHGPTIEHDAVVGEIAALVTAVGDPVDDPIVGLALPGFIDDDGRFIHGVNLPALTGHNPGKALGALGIDNTIVAVPDVAAATIAEARCGVGRQVERFLCVVIGTGINAALTVSGRIKETAFGCLGDAGQVPVEPDGPSCPCGGVGCVEAIVSGAAIAAAGAALGLTSARAVVEAGRAGDGPAAEILERAGRALGRGVAAWAAMTFPDRVAVAGGVAGAGALLLEPARRELRRVSPGYIADRIDLVPAVLGPRATLIGAGLVGSDAASST